MTKAIITITKMNAKLLLATAVVATALFSLSFTTPANAAGIGQGLTCGTTTTTQACATGLACINGTCQQPTFGVGAGDAVQNLGLGTSRLDQAVVRLINVALGFLGLIAVIIILIGGFKWMTAGGNEDKVGEARKTIFAGIIGLAIILFAWGITTFVIKNLGAASGIQGNTALDAL